MTPLKYHENEIVRGLNLILEEEAPQETHSVRDPSERRLPSSLSDGQRTLAYTSLFGTLNTRGASKETILAAIKTENAVRGAPPWDDKKVERLVDKLWKQYSHQGQHAKISGDVHESNGSREGTPATTGKPPGKRKQRIALSTFRQLQNENIPPIHWIITDLLAPGLHVLAGRPKSGKSWFVFYMVLMVAMGRWVMGQYPVKAQGVLYISLEDTKRRLKTRLAKLLGDEDAPENGLFTTEWERIQDSQYSDSCGIKDVAGYLEENSECRLVVIDTWGLIRGPRGKSRESDYERDYMELSRLQKIARAANVAIMLVHHTRKKVMDATDPLDEVLGSSGITGCADSIWVLSRRRGADTGILDVSGRDIPGDLKLAMTFEKESCRWEIAGDAVDVAKTALQDKILRALKDAGQPMSNKDIKDRVGSSQTYVNKALCELFDTDLVSKPAGTRGMYCLPLEM